MKLFSKKLIGILLINIIFPTFILAQGFNDNILLTGLFTDRGDILGQEILTQNVAKPLNARLVLTYDQTDFINGPLETLSVPKNIATSINGLEEPFLSEIFGYHPEVIAHSAGTATAVTLAKQGQLWGDELYLVSQVLVSQDDLRQIRDLTFQGKGFNKIVLYDGDDIISGFKELSINFTDYTIKAKILENFPEITFSDTSYKDKNREIDLEGYAKIVKEQFGKKPISMTIYGDIPGNTIEILWEDGVVEVFNLQKDSRTGNDFHDEDGILNIPIYDGFPHGVAQLELLAKFKVKYGRMPGKDDLMLFKQFIKEFQSKTEAVAIPARDPNIKYGPEGNVMPGQKLDYKVEFENEGEGIAFGVYFTDTLDEELDDSTLEIGPVISVQTGAQIAPAGTYDPQTRTVTWFVGEVGSKKGGYATLSANVRADVLDKAEIINFATVYFPSVPEVTRTNGVVSTVVSDMTPPVTTSSVSPAPNTNGWNSSDVTISLAAQDEINGSGVKEIRYTVNGAGEQFVSGDTFTIPFVTEGISTLNYWAVDKAGNIEQQKALEIKIDKTNPTIFVSNAPAPNSFGWNNADVSVTFTCADSVSGIASCTAPVTLISEGQNQVVPGSAVDLAGNSSSVSTIINLDKTPPMLTMPVLNPAYVYNSSASFNFSAVDSLSGLTSLLATFNGAPVANGTTVMLTRLGTNIFTLQAADEAGNTVSQSVTFEVQYAFSGFLPPVVADGSQVYKLGRTLPVKFQLQDANQAYVSTATAGLILQQFSDDVPIGDPMVVESTSGADTGNVFRYDSTDEQYIFNLNTNKLSPGTWQLKVSLDDGTTKTGFIKFK